MTNVPLQRSLTPGRIAQLEERGPYKAEVPGSIPGPPTTQHRSRSALSRDLQASDSSPPKITESPRITPGNGNEMATARSLPIQPLASATSRRPTSPADS